VARSLSGSCCAEVTVRSRAVADNLAALGGLVYRSRTAANRRANQRALLAAGNPDLPEAQYARGHLNRMLEWDWPAAEAKFRRAGDRSRSTVRVGAHVARPRALAIETAQRGTGNGFAGTVIVGRSHVERCRRRCAVRNASPHECRCTAGETKDVPGCDGCGARAREPVRVYQAHRARRPWRASVAIPVLPVARSR
jgi:hypothetical protein